MTRLPDFLHIGPGKSGSSWLHETLALHPEVYLSEANDLYFCCRYCDRGMDWYRRQFRSAQSSHRVVGEVCPDYLTCAEESQRIRSCREQLEAEVAGVEPQFGIPLRQLWNWPGGQDHG